MNKKLIIFCDGGARGNPGPAAWAFVVYKGGEVRHKESGFLGVTTNNVAEYQAVLNSLLWLSKNEFQAERVFYQLDSQLVVRQLNGEYKIKSENLRPLIVKIKALERQVSFLVTYNFVPRTKNKIADGLVNQELDAART